MEAANRGAREAGGKTIGLNIRLPFEQGANPYLTEELHFEFHYFFMRKFWFAYLAKALVIFPGGFGTLDELFEILTLVQTDKLSKKIGVILYGRQYWDAILNFGRWRNGAPFTSATSTSSSTPTRRLRRSSVCAITWWNIICSRHRTGSRRAGYRQDARLEPVSVDGPRPAGDGRWTGRRDRSWSMPTRTATA